MCYNLYMDIFNERIKQLRISRRLTQKDLAKALNVSRSLISKWETSDAIYASGVIKLARFFGCTSDYLLGLKDEFVVKNF